MQREKKRLTAQQFDLLRPRYQGHEENVIGMLLDHIDVAEVELARTKELNPAIEKIIAERERQEAKWGISNHDVDTWRDIFLEEWNETTEAEESGDRADYLTELVHAAAVLVAWIECELRKEQS